MHNEQGTDLIDLRQLFREMAGDDFFGGHCSLQTALEVKSDLRFEISDLNMIPYVCLLRPLLDNYGLSSCSYGFCSSDIEGTVRSIAALNPTLSTYPTFM